MSGPQVVPPVHPRAALIDIQPDFRLRMTLVSGPGADMAKAPRIVLDLSSSPIRISGLHAPRFEDRGQ